MKYHYLSEFYDLIYSFDYLIDLFVYLNDYKIKINFMSFWLQLLSIIYIRTIHVENKIKIDKIGIDNHRFSFL